MKFAKYMIISVITVALISSPFSVKGEKVQTTHSTTTVTESKGPSLDQIAPLLVPILLLFLTTLGPVDSALMFKPQLLFAFLLPALHLFKHTVGKIGKGLKPTKFKFTKKHKLSFGLPPHLMKILPILLSVLHLGPSGFLLLSAVLKLKHLIPPSGKFLLPRFLRILSHKVNPFSELLKYTKLLTSPLSTAVTNIIFKQSSSLRLLEPLLPKLGSLLGPRFPSNIHPPFKNLKKLSPSTGPQRNKPFFKTKLTTLKPLPFGKLLLPFSTPTGLKPLGPFLPVLGSSLLLALLPHLFNPLLKSLPLQSFLTLFIPLLLSKHLPHLPSSFKSLVKPLSHLPKPNANLLASLKPFVGALRTLVPLLTRGTNPFLKLPLPNVSGPLPLTLGPIFLAKSLLHLPHNTQSILNQLLPVVFFGPLLPLFGHMLLPHLPSSITSLRNPFMHFVKPLFKLLLPLKLRLTPLKPLLSHRAPILLPIIILELVKLHGSLFAPLVPLLLPKLLPHLSSFFKSFVKPLSHLPKPKANLSLKPFEGEPRNLVPLLARGTNPFLKVPLPNVLGPFLLILGPILLARSLLHLSHDTKSILNPLLPVIGLLGPLLPLFGHMLLPHLPSSITSLRNPFMHFVKPLFKLLLPLKPLLPHISQIPNLPIIILQLVKLQGSLFPFFIPLLLPKLSPYLPSVLKPLFNPLSHLPKPKANLLGPLKPFAGPSLAPGIIPLLKLPFVNVLGPLLLTLGPFLLSKSPLHLPHNPQSILKPLLPLIVLLGPLLPVLGPLLLSALLPHLPSGITSMSKPFIHIFKPLLKLLLPLKPLSTSLKPFSPLMSQIFLPFITLKLYGLLFPFLTPLLFQLLPHLPQLNLLQPKANLFAPLKAFVNSLRDLLPLLAQGLIPRLILPLIPLLGPKLLLHFPHNIQSILKPLSSLLRPFATLSNSLKPVISGLPFLAPLVPTVAPLLGLGPIIFSSLRGVPPNFKLPLILFIHEVLLWPLKILAQKLATLSPVFRPLSLQLSLGTPGNLILFAVMLLSLSKIRMLARAFAPFLRTLRAFVAGLSGGLTILGPVFPTIFVLVPQKPNIPVLGPVFVS